MDKETYTKLVNPQRIQRNIQENLAYRAGGSDALLSNKDPGYKWEEHVKSEDDAVVYFQRCYPQFGSELCRALAMRTRQLVEGYGDMSEEERARLVFTNRGYKWDVMSDIAAECERGKEERARKAAAELLAEDAEEKLRLDSKKRKGKQQRAKQ